MKNLHLSNYDVQEMDAKVMEEVNGGKPIQWWFVGLGFATGGVAFMVDFVHDVFVDKRQFDCGRWD